MVLSPPAAPPQPAQGVDGWIAEIQQGLRLSPAGVLILVDNAIPEKLGGLVRALLADHPDLDVFTSVGELEQAADGAVIVFVPEASDADWLNLNRPMFARKALKVVLFCSRETSVALAHRAPDFFDWISHRQECPPGVAEHAIWGIRKALLARAPGVIFVSEEPNRRERLEQVFREALPGRPLRWLAPLETPYVVLVDQIRNAGRAWVACDSPGYAETERFRWALADAGRRTRAILVLPQGFEDRFWHVSDALWKRPPDAFALLARAGAKHPGRLAAVAGLEVPVIAALIELLARGHHEDTLLGAMLRALDPGESLAERILSAGVEESPLQGWLMSSPVQRHLGRRIGLRRGFPGRKRREVEGWEYSAGGAPPLLRGRAERIEFLLCQGTRTPERWIELGRLALAHGDPDAAATWAGRSLAMRERSEAYGLYGIALVELSRINLERGVPVGKQLHMDAARLLLRAEQTLDSSTPPEDVLGLNTHMAEVLLDVGLTEQAERPLRLALEAIDLPSARANDLARIARVLGRKGRPDRAEEILKSALGKTRDPTDQARIRLELGFCVFAQGRFDEAEAIAAELSDDLDARAIDRRGELRGGADTLRIRTWLSRDEPRKALELADAALAAAAPRWAALDADAVSRMPMLAITLNRAGRAADAEAILRKVLGLPIDIDTSAVAMGLASEDRVRAFLAASPVQVGMAPSIRRELWSELLQALRAQGRHLEAAEMERRRDEESGAPPA